MDSPIPDVFNMIIEHLVENKRALKACTLVSRSWHDLTVPHLFRSIRVEFARLQASDKGFLPFLQKTPAIAQHIAYLRFTAIPGHARRGNFEPDPPHLSLILSLLIHLQSLSIYAAPISVKSTAGDLTLAPPTTPLTLRHVGLTKLRISEPHLVELLGYFGEADEVAISSITCPSPSSENTADWQSLSPRFRVRRLTVDRTFLSASGEVSTPVSVRTPLYRAVLRDHSTIQSFTQYNITRLEEILELGDLIYDAQLQIRHVGLHILQPLMDPTTLVQGSVPKQYWTRLHLSSQSDLDSLQLPCVIGIDNNNFIRHTETAMLDILETVPVTLSHLEFHITITNRLTDMTLSQLELDWTRFGALLNRFHSLSSLKILLFCPHSFLLYVPLEDSTQVPVTEVVGAQLKAYRRQDLLQIQSQTGCGPGSLPSSIQCIFAS